MASAVYAQVVVEHVNESIIQSEARFRELFDETPVAYHEIDATGVNRRINRAECALFACARTSPASRSSTARATARSRPLKELDASTRTALLRKPFDVARLLQAVRQCLDSG